ncbi:hypothetical protein ABZ027_36870 [Streptomyces sp. NPDC006332]|uniref:hypothetical protein n=1 Tax=Streptomyces sp. NPDC006332 TaxID=3155456 RepID=UPI0033BB3F29
MKTLVTASPPLPHVGHLSPRQQMAMDCALCARRLGARGRVLGDVRHRGLPFQLWVCIPDCRVARPTVPSG